MAKRKFNISIEGRVKKVKANDFLVSLYEAISNSIHSIESGGKKGAIEVQILREPRQAEIQATAVDLEQPITGFIVTDSGLGFTENDMISFCEADSTFKAKIGGKGVGRFSWLKFFENASIESVFQDGAKRKRRTFLFSSSGIDEEELVVVTSDPGTTVKLSPLHVSFETKTRKSLDQVSIEIVEHFIAYLVTGALPSLKIRDGSAMQDIGDLYQRSIGKHTKQYDFVIKGQNFQATGLRFFLGSNKHTIFLCGDRRVSEKLQLVARDPVFSRRFTDEDLRQYAFHLFVQSEYLDSIVNDDREGFRFPEAGSLEASSSNAITKDEIAEETLKIARQAMSAEIEKIKHANTETVKSFVAQEAPQYRNLITKHTDAVASIHESDKIKIDQALRRLQFEDELTTKRELSALMRKADEVDPSNKDEWQKKSAEMLTRLSEEGKANLANYIVHRKMILEMLQKLIDVGNDGFALEKAIHNLIFPMTTTSDDVDYENQNLWIIDERLSYHYYLASDKPLKSTPPAETNSAKEPDVIIFDRPIALNNAPESETAESIVILEFKRPGETSVDGQKNPVDQILEYIELIQSGRANTRKGRPIPATEKTYFFGYVVCELDPLLKTVLKRRTMKETPDGRGMFGFFPDHKAYVEVISFDKMLSDAKKRNRILFEKLQLPTK